MNSEAGRIVRCCACIAMTAAFGWGNSNVAAGSPGIGSVVEAFSLPDYHGKPRSLGNLAGTDFVVVAFLGVDCPLARLYAPRLQQLCEEFAPRGVTFVGVDSNEQDSLVDMAAFANRYGVKFPFLKDRDQTVADQFGARRNPVVYVLDRKRVIRYAGRVDDQYGLGSNSAYARAKLQRRDLAVALDELLSGKEVSQPETAVAGCIIGRKRQVQPKGDVTYTRHIAKVLDEHCVSCHRPGEIGPFGLSDYEEAAGWADMIREVVSQGRMPPWSANPAVGQFRNDPRLSKTEIELINSWVDNGCPKGDPMDLPKPRERVEGWQISKPDQVVRMPRPYTVAAEGVLPYQRFSIDPGWKRDKWIRAAEVRPGSRAVVHHILVSVIPPLTHWLQRRGAGGPTQLTSYVPGSVPHIYEPGFAVYAPAGSQLLFEIHYTPNGVAQDDQSSLGLVFADPTTVKRRVLWQAAENRQFTIPPNAKNHELESRHRFTEDELLLSMSPHMHMRGRAFQYEAQYPDGKRELLLDVPRYDFNWQLRYDLTEPERMPAGTTLVCKGRFDNSADNPANPDPNATLHFGWQSSDEMMTGFFVTVPVDEEAPDGQVGAN